MKRAVIYHAHCRKRYSDAAIVSARSAKKAMPDIDTVLITSLPVRSKRFDRIIRIDDPGIVNAQFPPLLHLPEEYDSAIYLDCITLVVAKMYDVFELVEDSYTDIALTHTSGKPHDDKYPSPGLPKLFPHWRSAFIAFQNHDRMRKFFSDWWGLFEIHREEHAAIRAKGYGPCHPDQKSMRIALYHSDLTVTTLRSHFCCPAGGVIIRGIVRVITGDGDMTKRAAIVNKHAPERRLFHNGKVTVI